MEKLKGQLRKVLSIVIETFSLLVFIMISRGHIDESRRSGTKNDYKLSQNSRCGILIAINSVFRVFGMSSTMRIIVKDLTKKKLLKFCNRSVISIPVS